MGNVLDDEIQQRVSKLHTVLRPYLLRRLKRDVEKELPSKYEHLVLCPLSKRQGSSTTSSCPGRRHAMIYRLVYTRRLQTS